jgi:hypothetical protein
MMIVIQFWIFMVMNKMTKHIRIRVTEDQFRRLADALIDEERSKSAIIREALHNYLEDKYQRKKVRIENNNKN